MNVIDFINFLHEKKIYLKVQNGKLQINAAKGAMTQTLLAQLKEKKGQIIEYLDSTKPGMDIVRVSREQVLKASYSQQSLWLLEQIDSGTEVYNMPAALKLTGDLNLIAIQQAFTSVVARHESLRTCFAAGEDGEPIQVIQAAEPFDVPVTDLSGVAEGERETQIRILVTKEAALEFDLSRDLMLRAKLIKVSSQEHVLLVTMHHIASDGWSMGILVNEFSHLYSAYVQGQENPLPPLAIQYADYANWQRQWLQGEVLDAQMGYWEKQLADLPDVHGLPLDYPRPSIQSFAGDVYVSTIAKDTLDGLKDVCQRQGATLFMGLHAAFSVLLSRYSNEKDIVLGTPVANREQSEIAELIGFFVNTLVLRSNLSGNPSFNELLRQSKTMLLEGYAHQQVPFEQIVERLQPQRSLSHSPLFQVMIEFQNNDEGNLSLPGLTAQYLDHQGGMNVAKFDLTLNIFEGQDGLHLGWHYNTDLFKRESIEGMSQHFNLLLAELLRLPEESVFALELVSDEERRQILCDWNDTQADFPSQTCIHELFEHQAEQNPQKEALVYQGVAFSYDELNLRANQLAHYLKAQGVKPDTLVGLCIERSFDMVIGLLGILKAGAAFVPLEPSYPEARIAYMLDDGDMGIVITQQRFLSELPLLAPLALCLDDDKVRDELASMPQNNQAVSSLGLCPHHLAYVIYTSGSTGKPKGVMVEHQALSNRIYWMDQEYTSTPQDRFLQKTPFSFDVSVWEFIWPLTTGASLVLAKPEGHKDPAYLSSLMAQENITKVHFVPSMLGSMLAFGLLGDCRSLKQIFCSGEALSRHHVDDVLVQCPNVELHNLYGPTEASIDVSFWNCRETALSASIPIGRPIANTQLYVMDQQQHLAPIGVAGELYIGGIGLARGYIKREQLTAEKFVENPFYDKHKPSSSPKLYRTGDLVRWLADGTLEYLGRIDHQVKVRGFRIELGEIEHALAAYPGVKEAVVLARELVQGDSRLIGYLVAPEAGSDDAAFIEDIRHYLGRQLPEYMLPSFFVLLDSLPLTANGKLDRNAMPEPDMLFSRKEYLAPRTEMEKILCTVWQEVLGVERVGIRDNFFELGGHSLLVMQVISRLQQQGKAMAARQLFAARSLEELAVAMSEHQEKEVAVFRAPKNLIPAQCQQLTPEMLPLVDLTPVEIEHLTAQVPGGAENIQDIYPLGPLQQGILFHHTLDPENDPYVTPILFKLDDEAAVNSFIEGLEFLIARHDVFRSSMQWQGVGEPIQIVQREAKLSVGRIRVGKDQSPLNALEEYSASQRIKVDLRRAPLLNVTVATAEGEAERHVLLQIHHIIEDATSLQICEKELAYFLGGISDQLQPPVPYREFIAHALHLAQVNDAQAYFSQTLGDITEPTLPFNLHNIQGKGSNVTELAQALPQNLSIQLREVAKKIQVTPAALFHAGWARVIATCSGKDDVVFGTVMSGRLQGTFGAEEMLGVFINTLPVRVKSAGADAVTLVQQVQASLLDLLPYEQASLSMAQACSGLKSNVPLFSSILNYRHQVRTDADDETLEKEGHESSVGIEEISGQERTNYPVSLSVDDLGESFTLNIKVVAEISAQQVMAYMYKAIEILVQALSTDSAVTLDTLSLLPDEECKTLLDTAKVIRKSGVQEACIHELFERSAKAHPQETALITKAGKLSYDQLNRRANQLARYLKQQGVKPDTLVGLCVERSVDMVVGILGILKAGGAYVPLDPAYPQARLTYMLRDSGVKLVLSQSWLTLPQEQAVETLYLDKEDIFAEQAQDNPEIIGDVGPKSAVYMIYTSGSTGRPKGVVIEQRNLLNFRQVFEHQLEQLDAQKSNWLWHGSFAFDASVKGILALCSGNTLVVASEREALEPSQLLALTAQHDIQVLNLTPALVPVMLDCLEQGDRGHLHLMIGGEALGKALWDRVAAYGARHDRQALNLYGPTETTINASYAVIDGEVMPHIGKPVANTQFYVMDSRQQLVPTGVVGELYIGGTGVARGYLNRDELTAEKFVANPYFDAKDSNSCRRLYRSGDLVRWRADGELEFIGRIDHQVKVRGLRIELGEIEQCLVGDAGVREAAVLAREAGNNDNRLVAYLVPGESLKDEAAFIEAVREQLRKALPDYMVPAAFVVLEALPLTVNGKLDRHALPEPEGEFSGDYIAPQTEMEKILCEIWQEVLGVEQVGILDNFFELGGHSLLVMRVISRLQQQNLVMSASQLFSTPSLAALAKLIVKESVDDARLFKAPPNLIPADCVALTPQMLPLVDLNVGEIEQLVAQIPGGVGNIQDIYPLGPLQQGILFHHTLDPENDPYVLSAFLKIPDLHQVQAFIDGLDFLIKRHDVLRTSIHWEGVRKPVQIVRKQVGLAVLTTTIEQQQNPLVYLQEYSESEGRQMDLRSGPLLRVIVASQGDSAERYVLLQWHHIISDHVAFEVIQKELKLYSQGLQQQLLTPVQYREFIAHSLHQEKANDAEQYFTNMLSDVSEPSLPFNLINVQGKGNDITEFSEAFPAPLGEELRAIAKNIQISPAAIFHAGWARVMAACSGKDDVVFGTVMSGRLQGTSGVEQALGVFINTLPIRVKLAGANAQSLVQQVQTSLLDSLPYEQASLSMAQRCSSLSNGMPLFSSVFNYRHSGSGGIEMGKAGLQAQSFTVEFLKRQERTNYPLSLSVDDFGDAFQITVKGIADIATERVIEYMQGAMKGLVEALRESSSARLDSRELLPESERQQLLHTWNDTEAEVPLEYCLHELFAEQADRFPKKTALVCDGISLSYGELNRRANQLARYLKQQGVKPDTLVGLCVERSVDMVVGILGILKAGGAYVPLDPAYPQARLTYMLRDSGVKLVLSQSWLTLPQEQAVETLYLDKEDIFAEQAQDNPEIIGDVGPKSAVYMIYTSGSTGRPKGVVIEQRNLLNFRQVFEHQLEQLDAQKSNWLWHGSFAFDASVKGILALCSGNTLVVASEREALEPSQLLALTAQHDIQVLNLTPALVPVMLDCLEQGDRGHLHLMIGGEALGKALWDRVAAYGARHDRQALNLYGPTETTINASYAVIDGEVMPHIGKPVANTQFYVMDSRQQLVPTGVVGELYIGGTGVARGYLNRDELTAEKFVANPYFDAKDSNSCRRLYRSGDLVRWRADGELEFIGRIDHQVKVRGLRIELGEIEQCLVGDAGVREAAVLAREAGNNDNRLVAYLVPDESLKDEAAFIEAVREQLRKALPDYMVPAAFVVLEALPLTVNGKLDRHALPEPESAVSSAQYVAPRTDTEAMLCSIWQQVLEVDRVGVMDNFFALGGHSLMAISLVTQIKEAFAIEYSGFSIREVFELSSVAELAASIDILLSKQKLQENENLIDSYKEEELEEGVL
ncbi:non-ribosomal peptide synthetase [Pseudoalteromonas maricaloris]|uniref:Amino acid adenylation domain-containing protein n=7 Tax=Pseudoalteromonas TaxID=53246 RepID=A0ABZ0MBF7_9GAMM|nr:non-ribosomal peptide synthetase [Pseudoalteromonas maricaloris]WOX28820.1 amino acid adenylation domain-containing protein [Pseudoalteromonas maricaloris]